MNNEGADVMKEISPAMIKELRERTGVGMGKCKEALVQAGGDIEKAIDILRKAGMASAAKKEGRETKEGAILTAQNDQNLVLVEANAETDFVVQNERFSEFLKTSAEQALKSSAKTLDEFLQEPYAKDPSITVDQYRNLVIQALGENIQLRKFEKIKKKQDASYGIYSHMGGKLVVVVELTGSSEEEALAKEIAMHIAAENPEYLHREDIPTDVLKREEEVARSQVANKPPQIVDKIVGGKIQAYVDQFCLLNQKYIKDTSQTVQQFVEAASKKSGKPLAVRAFWRWKVGQ